MNYLSHYYFDSSEDNKYYNLGLVLPDLARSHISKLRINPYKNIEFTTSEISSINKGCNKHFASDRKFHNWMTFVELTGRATDMIRESGDKDINRDYFITHILVEVLLDKILLDKNPNLAEDFYAMIDSVEMDWMLKYMRYAGLQDDELWKGQHRRFMKAAFLKNYTSIENVVYSVEQVALKTGLVELNDDQRNLLIEICETIEPDLERSIGALEIQLL
ncbi:MAG: hypothetical protein KJP21_08160 [Bacteroidia bacterium]|nr:hypothetical protein [Bacteroidia bacterium]NNJ54530.1 hypothetical protein [Bacteroidia bacterium]